MSLLVAGLFLLVSGCGGPGTSTVFETPPGPTETGVKLSLYHPRYPLAGRSDRLRSQLDSAECPAGVDRALWDSLVGELRDSLSAAAEADIRDASILPSGAGNQLPEPRLVDDGGSWRLEWD
ncbi:MAG TPA: hypothetical protein ENO21_02195, partial [Firmicutes bacterium]|nr:hypothetical protein [Bacillota bacterium]